MNFQRPAALTVPAQGNASIYTLDTVQQYYHDDQDDPDSHNDRSPLLSPLATPTYGSTFPRSPGPTSSAKVIFNATLKMACIFAFSTIILGGTLWLALPTLEECVFHSFSIASQLTTR